MNGTVRAGAVCYTAMPPKAFDDDWLIGREPALRWFSRADRESERLTGHKPCGAPAYGARRTTLTRSDYLDWAYNDERCFRTSGCYFSPNLFYRWRNQKQLTGFCANWIEIDTHGHATLDADGARRVLEEVAKALWDAALPLPTSLVTTGSGGVHLYWLYNAPVMSVSKDHREALLVHWRRLNATLVSALEASRQRRGFTGWAVDRNASNNPSGVMRLPGSSHGKTGREVIYYRGGERVIFERFAQALGLREKAPKPPTPQRARAGAPAGVVQRGCKIVVQQRLSTSAPTPERLPTPAPGEAQGYDSPGQRQVIRTLIHQWERYLVRQGCVPQGQRDLTAFHLFNCARRVMDADAAWAYIIEINDRHIRLPRAQLERYLSTAREKVYFYALSTLKRQLVEDMGLPLHFPAPRRPMARKQITQRQARAGRRTSQQLRRSTLDQLVRDARTLLNQGLRVAQLTKARVLRVTEVSRATLYRHWDRLMSALRQQEVPTLAELFQSAQGCLTRSPSSYNAAGEAPFGVAVEAYRPQVGSPGCAPTMDWSSGTGLLFDSS